MKGASACGQVSLELGKLVAGAGVRGEFEQRIRDILDEVTKNNDTILSPLTAREPAFPNAGARETETKER